jgi:serine/threonine protein kinase
VSLNGYLLEDCLGSSSHTAVYRAVARGGAEWAVKVIDGQLEPSGSLWERIRREAGLLSNVDHPDILPIHEAGRADTMTFAASPLMRARSLQDLMATGSLNNELAWRILTQIADALDSVHYRGLVFRVLKPVNILVDDCMRPSTWLRNRSRDGTPIGGPTSTRWRCWSSNSSPARRSTSRPRSARC